MSEDNELDFTCGLYDDELPRRFKGAESKIYELINVYDIGKV